MSRLRILAQLLAAGATVALASPAYAQTPGYVPRASGFDLNFNGAAGQGGTADVNICDGQGDGSSTVGEDIDGNGVNDRQVYVDLSGGNDSSSCGLPGSPCGSITYAMNGGNTSVPGGPIQAPAAGQIQAICFKGIGRETVVPTWSGASGTYVLAQTGRQARSFKLPRYPFILSGWDTNNNDRYPPYDSADVAVLDGTLGGQSLPYAIDNSINHVSNIEYAHFTARNYGQNGETNEGFTVVVGGGGTASQIYYHDLQLTDIMKGQANSSMHIVFHLFVTGTILSDLAVVNLNVTNAGGGYFVRGSGAGNAVAGPYRFQNISLTAFGRTDDYWAGFKLWDYVTGVEIIDNDFNANPAAWGPHASGGAGTFGIGVSYCSSDWQIRGNTFTDFKQSVTVSPYYGSSGFCESRLTDNVVVDRNIFRNSYAPWQFGDWGIQIEPGLNTVDTTKTVTITNNFLSSVAGWEACIWANGGNQSGPQTGTVTIAGNTCYGPINRHAAIVIGNPESSQPAFPQQNYVIKDNIIAGTQGGTNIMTKVAIFGLVINGNVYDPTQDFSWLGGSQTLAAWRTSSGGDQNSKQCVPAFVNAAQGNFRLDPSDSCAKSSGVSLTSITAWDIDGNTRSAANPSIGASETGLKTPGTPTNLRILR
jgi:hypothetical protein